MRKLIPSLFTMLGLSTPEPHPEATEAAPVLPGAAHEIAHGPRSMFTSRRAYVPPLGDWTTPNRPSLRRTEDRATVERKRARRAAAWARTCEARGYA